jgi:hypothetical protein
LTIQADEGVPLQSPLSERRCPLCHKLLRDSRFYELLLKFDADLAAADHRRGCRFCGGRLDGGRYPRKPRVPAWVTLPAEYDRRFSFSCATRTCRRRHTPASTRFLGRRVYLGAIVVLATAMQQGLAPWRLSQLRDELGVSRQTLVRWRTWWAESFTRSAFWKVAKAAFASPVDEAALPLALIVRFAGDAVAQLGATMNFLSPLATSAGCVPDQRQ